MKSILVVLSLVLICGVSFGHQPYPSQQTVIIRQNVVPTAVIETIGPHKHITDELVVPVTKIIQVAQYDGRNLQRRGNVQRGNYLQERNLQQRNRLFNRRVVVRNRVRVQEIIVNKRVVAVAPVFNQYGYTYRNNINFNVYGRNQLRFNDFDYRVNNQFYDSYGNLVRQFKVREVIIAEEVVPVQYVVQFRQAYVQRNFVVLRQVRNNCQFRVY